jgi:DUF1009 family protein
MVKERTADRDSQQTLGVIAGNGPLPVVFAREAQALGLKLVAVAHFGETQPELERYVEEMTWVHVGELGRLIEALVRGAAKQTIMLGGIDKRRALQDFRPDERGLRLLQSLVGRGDDALLVALADELEQEGVKVVDSSQWLAPWLASEGVLGRHEPGEQEVKDIQLGIAVLGRIGALDIGQTVVIKQGVILAVEAVEGTDQAVLRGGELGGPGAVVVKGSKPQQDMRFDVPVVGPETLHNMVTVGAKVLALEADRTFLLDRDSMLRLAEREGVGIMGWRRPAGEDR